MVARVNGAPKEGVWVERNVKFLQITVTGMTAATDIANEVVNSGLEQVLEAVATRGTLLGLSVASETVIHVMLGYAGAHDTTDDAIGLELEAAINAVATPDLSAAAVVVADGFAAA